jgi:hypothetical protein
MKKTMTLLLAFCLLLGLPSLSAQDASPDASRLKEISLALGMGTDFQALVEISVGLGDMAMEMRVYASEKAVRSEMQLPGGFGTMTTLTLEKDGQNEIYLLSPEQKSYTKLPNPMADALTAKQEAQKIQASSLGQETKNGLPCEKFKVIQDGRQLLAWVTERDGAKVPVCVEMQESGIGTLRLTFKEYAAGHQEPALLKLPADYQEKNPLETIINFAK